MVVVMKKGDRVYLVVPMLMEDHYIVQSRALTVATAKQLRLESCFSFHVGEIYRPCDLGRKFYATPAEAVAGFVRAREQALVVAQQNLRRAEERAVEARTFAESWSGAVSGERLPGLRKITSEDL